MTASIVWGVGGKASVLVGGNWGSEGKGQVAAWLSRFIVVPFGVATTNAGAQAGHTTRHRDGPNFVCYHLPTTAVMLNPKWQAYINGGSIIDVDAFLREIKDTGIDESAVMVHPNAAVITPDDRASEQTGTAPSIASTQKGVGAALANKVRRSGLVARKAWALEPFVSEPISLNSLLANGHPVVVEVPQGLELSINHGYEYPYVTSRDCWVGSGLSDAGIHPSFLGPVAMVVRTFPIRVGGIYDGDKLVGTSGPFYPDQRELNWELDFPGVEPERTTVTKRVRRIAAWSDDQYMHACSMNRPDIVVLTFCDYLRDVKAFAKLVSKMKQIESQLGLAEAAVEGLLRHQLQFLRGALTVPATSSA